MTVKKYNWHWTILVFLSMSAVCSAQSVPQNVGPGDSTRAFANKLLEAHTEVERDTILDQNRQLLTAELSQLLFEQGRNFFRQGNFSQATIHLKVLRRVSEKIDDKLRLAQAATALGNVYRLQGKDTSALVQLREALTLHQAAGNKQGEFFSLLSIVIIDISGNNYDEARLQKLQALAEESRNDEWRALSMSQLGSMQFLQGHYALALESHQRSLKLYERLDAKEGIAFALHSLGILQRVFGNYEQALEYFRKSLELTESLKRRDLAARSLSSIGAVHGLMGNQVQAMDYHQASLKAGEISGSKFWTIFSLNSVAEIYAASGQLPQALMHLERALKLSEDLDYKDRIAYVSLSIGNIKYLEGDFSRAIEFAERARAIAKQTSSQDALWKALTLTGKAYHALNQKEKAREVLAEATDTVELLRSNVVGQGLRSSYFATVQEPYEVYVDVLMQQHRQNPNENYDVLALQVNERSIARSLLETLNEARADIRMGVDQVLLARERSFQQQLNARAARQLRISPTDPEAASVKKEVDALTAQYRQAEAQIRQSSPRYAALTQPVPLTMKQIQTELLDADTALLEYSIGEARSYLWFVTSNSHESFELPKRAELEANVRRTVELLGDGKRWATDSQGHSEYQEQSTKLSRVLLPPALMSKLKVKRLLIVGSGTLQYLPFAALPNLKSGGSSSQSSNRQPLVADYEIVTLPSASTLAVLRRETMNRTSRSKTVVVIADPVFEETDERVTTKRGVAAAEATGETRHQSSETVATSRALLQRAAEFETKTEAGGAVRESLQIKRLPFTRFEAEGILAMASAQQSLKATDFRANRETATNPDLAQYRIVHFATHAILNSEHPELSGIVLSLVDKEGKPVDGFLRLHDIYNLNLPADLIVLSACQTGLGREIRGEGLIGLTRGFMYAGAPRVVASLWKVDDAATAELMKSFYSAMLKDNLRPAAALRRAKIEMWKQKRWQAPYYWAAFELQGEWR